MSWAAGHIDHRLAGLRAEAAAEEAAGARLMELQAGRIGWVGRRGRDSAPAGAIADLHHIARQRGQRLHSILKLRVPEDMAIVGCGDISLAALVCPRLTTVGHPKQHLGAQAVYLLLELFNNSLVDQRVVLPCELVVRESCGAGAHPDWHPSRTRLRLS